VEPDVNSLYIHTGTRVDQMYGVGADAAPIDLRGWSRWPEILWRRASTRGLLADQLRHARRGGDDLCCRRGVCPRCTRRRSFPKPEA